MPRSADAAARETDPLADPPIPPRARGRGWPRAVDGEIVVTDPRDRRPLRGADRRPAPRSRSPRGAARAAAGRTCRSSASTPRRPGSRRRPGRWHSSIGLGWWEGERFRQVQLLLPDHADEPALLDGSPRHDPAGRVARDLQRPRLRLAAARHPLSGWLAGPRPPTAATSTCCRSCGGCSAIGWPMPGCGRSRRSCSACTGIGDVDGWEIPGRYLEFLRGGPAEPLAEVVRHNDEDVRSLARLLATARRGYASADGATGRRADRATWRVSPAPSSASAGSRRPSPASTTALAEPSTTAGRPRPRAAVATAHARTDDPVVVAATAAPTSADARRRDRGPVERHRDGGLDAPWTRKRIAVDRAHLLRRLGPVCRCRRGVGRRSPPDPDGPRRRRDRARQAPRASPRRPSRAPSTRQLRGLGAADRRRRLGMPEPGLEADLRPPDSRGCSGVASTSPRSPRGAATVARRLDLNGRPADRAPRTPRCPGRSRGRGRTSRPSSADHRPAR